MIRSTVFDSQKELPEVTFYTVGIFELYRAPARYNSKKKITFRIGITRRLRKYEEN
jgi:hypothetical protein